MSKNILKRITLSLAALLCVTTVSMAEEKAVPDATITLSGGSAGAGIGFQWGTGTLNYKGKSYDIKYNGLSLGEVGASGKSLSGEVYGLTDIGDFEGRYAALKAGAALAAGGEVTTMKNDKGVQVTLHGVERGAKVTLGTEGLKFTFADDMAKKQG